MKANFEKCFYVPEHSSEDHAFNVEKKYINRRGIYKDTYKSCQGFTDY